LTNYAIRRNIEHFFLPKITYPDFLVYHMIDDDLARNRLADYPNLAKFAETFEQRPNIKNYLTTLPPYP
jgi:hypothetical protein